jgi:hypothetical protein
MTTILQFQSAYGHWYEQRANAELTLDMDTTKIATMKLDQRWFLEKGLTQYYGFDPAHATNAAEIPEELKIIGRFLTIDDTTGLEVEDRFELLSIAVEKHQLTFATLHSMQLLSLMAQQ